MAEYNIQMNRYVSASDSYDQLFPKTKTVDVVDQNGDNLDTLLADKQDEILISGILKGNGSGGISAAVAGTDYAAMRNLHGRNLLDNPWFVNPINQRGVASGATWGTNKYGLDRWYSDTNNAVKWNSAGYLVMPANTDNCIISQKIENRGIQAGTKLTASVLMADGTILKSTFNMPAVGSTEYGVFYGTEFGGSTFANSVNGYYTFRLWYKKGNTTDGHVVAIKLELGRESTLANDSAPNYAEELAKCQRYFYKWTGLVSAANNSTISSIVAHSNVFFPVEMRAKPVIANITYNDSNYADGFEGYKNEARFYKTNGGYTVTGFTASADL